MGDADPLELSGRVRASNVTDPAAGTLFEVVLSRGPGAVVRWGSRHTPRRTAMALPADANEQGLSGFTANIGA